LILLAFQQSIPFVRLWLAASSARSAIVPLTSPSSQERAEAMARIRRSRSSASIFNQGSVSLDGRQG